MATVVDLTAQTDANVHGGKMAADDPSGILLLGVKSVPQLAARERFWMIMRPAAPLAHHVQHVVLMSTEK